MTSRSTALVRTAIMSGAGLLIEAARRGMHRVMARKRREVTMRRATRVATKVGLVAAVAGLSFWMVSAYRAR